MEICKYGGWDNNIRLSNGQVDLIITLDVGPRIIRFGFNGQPNVFKEFPEQLGQSRENEWRIRGGHRLWVAPEAAASYAKDNFPVSYREISPLHVVVTPPAETENGWQKEIEIKLEKTTNLVTVTHRIKNISDRPSVLSVWALSVMDVEGTALIPVPPKGTHPENLLPDLRVVLWPYSNYDDPRFIKKNGAKNFCIKQSSSPDAVPNKFGLLHQLQWAGYQLGKQFFVKTIPYIPGATYPDYGSNFELFTNKEILELESLAPLITLNAGETSEHTEKWALLEQASPLTIDSDMNGVVKKALGIE